MSRLMSDCIPGLKRKASTKSEDTRKVNVKKSRPEVEGSTLETDPWNIEEEAALKMTTTSKSRLDGGLQMTLRQRACASYADENALEAKVKVARINGMVTKDDGAKLKKKAFNDRELELGAIAKSPAASTTKKHRLPREPQKWKTSRLKAPRKRGTKSKAAEVAPNCVETSQLLADDAPGAKLDCISQTSQGEEKSSKVLTLAVDDATAVARDEPVFDAIAASAADKESTSPAVDRLAMAVDRRLLLVKRRVSVIAGVMTISSSSSVSTLSASAASSDDEEDRNDVMFCSSYVHDVMAYCRTLEIHFKISGNYLEGNPDVTPDMRALLVDWLIQVQEHQELLGETLHMSIIMIDIYLSREQIALEKLQLLGVACILIAAKYEERFPPPIKELVYLTDNTYCFDEIIRMERIVLRVLAFEMFIPTPLVFLPWYVKVVLGMRQNSLQIQNCCLYVLELTLIDAPMAVVMASAKSAAALWLVLCIFASTANSRPAGDLLSVTAASHSDNLCASWTDYKYSENTIKTATIPVVTSPVSEGLTRDCRVIKQFTLYSQADLQPTVHRMAKLLYRASKSQFQAARIKYTSSCYMGVAQCPELTDLATLRKIFDETRPEINTAH